MNQPTQSAIVVSDVYGQRGGAHRVTSLLCKSLAHSGITTTCFSTWVDSDSITGEEAFSIVQPKIRRGHRWDIPNRVLAWQAARFIENTQPTAVFVVGLTKICGHLLTSTIASQLLVWELTNADTGNKFVDQKAASNLSRCRKVLSPAATIDDGIRSTYSYAGEITRLPFWIEDERIESVAAPDEFQADFLFLARREDDKGLRELIQATANVARNFPDVRVLIAGPGDDAPYRALAKSCGVESCVKFCSLPNRSDAMQTLARCRFLVLPSYHEGYPLSLLEAAQYGIPFIATDVGSITEVFGGCKGCLIVPPRDVDSLAESMKSRLSMSADQYSAARREVHERFSELSSDGAIRRRLQSVLKDDAQPERTRPRN